MKLVSDEVEAIAENGITEEELNNYKEYTLKNFREQLRKNDSWLAYLSAYYNDGQDYFTGFEEQLNSLTTAQVQALAQKIVKDGNLIRVIMDPKK